MTKNKIYRIFYVISAILLTAFVVVLAVDHRLCYKCDPGFFFVLLFKRMYEFLLPSLLTFLVGVFFRQKFNK